MSLPISAAVIAALLLPTALQTTPVITVAPKIAEGRLEGCQITFDVPHQDWTYSRGEWVQAAGSLSLMRFEDRRLTALLKLGLLGLEGSEDNTAPATAFLVTDFATNAEEQIVALDADAPGYRLFGFDLRERTGAAVFGTASTGTFRLGYTVAEGRTAELFDVQLSQAQTADFRRCVTVLLEEE
jgi:hypothetical protein